MHVDQKGKYDPNEVTGQYYFNTVWTKTPET